MGMNTALYPLVKDGPVYYRDLTGHCFGRLQVLARVVKRKARKGQQDVHWWKCRCICGQICHVDMQPLVCGHTQSCGCLSQYNRSRSGHCPAFRAIIIDHRINTTKSCSQIGNYFGITKNSVVGILDRAGMIGNPETEPTTMATRLDRFTFPTNKQCAYPNGTPWEPGFSWCMAPVRLDDNKAPISSFCAEHHGKCFIDPAKTPKSDVSIATMDLSQQRPNRNGSKPGAAASSPTATDEAA